MTPSRIAIVGASLAANRTIRALRRKGYDGGIVLIGAEPHLPYDRPPLSKQFLAGDLDHDRIEFPAGDVYDGVDLRLGVAATRLRPADRAVELADGSEVVADHVVIATGATPRRLPHQPDLAGVHVLRTVDDATALRTAFDRRDAVAVVGAGFIGSEVASTARGRGLDVTVVEADTAPVVRGVGPVIGGALAALHRQAGVDLRLGVGVAALVGEAGRVTGVELADGAAVPADAVLVAIGVVPATGWLENSGLTLGNGVVVDDHLRAEGGGGHVWAVGDVANFPSARFGERLRIEHWTNATEQATVVATNLLGGDAVHDPVPYVWSDQFGVKIQVLGRVAGGDDVAVVSGALDADQYVAAFFRDGRLRGVVGQNAPRAVMSFRPLLEAGAADRAAVDAHLAAL
jgi:3-phenylpropionate/trans-cinnamate dioxygenase ferredoxin reductase component